MFSDTQNGAEASALVYSIVETAKANNVDIYYYLKYLLVKTPTMQTSDEDLEKLCPWNPECKNALEELKQKEEQALLAV